MLRTAILLEGWETWRCLPLDDTISTYTPSITAMEGSMFMSIANPWPFFNPLGREKATMVPRTQPVFSTWNLVTSSRLFRLTPTVKFTCIPTTPTLERIWFNIWWISLDNCTITSRMKVLLIYTKKLLNSDWLRKECSSSVTRMQTCNTSANYKWFLIDWKHKRNHQEPIRSELF